MPLRTGTAYSALMGFTAPKETPGRMVKESHKGRVERLGKG